MPQYFFDIIDGTALRDGTGTTLAQDDQAVSHAGRIASELALLPHVGPQRVVSVIHEDGHQVARVAVRRAGDSAADATSDTTRTV